ncbi:MAG: hypothetical protein RLZZ15_2132 [Verrucomicrobiota bacterium]|jgi:alkylated DNA repair dioxygenase AlkB
MSETIAAFERRGWVVLPAGLPAGSLKMLEAYALNFAKHGESTGDRLVPGTPAGYGHPCMERILLQLAPTIAAATKRAVWPTYSYFRAYRRGDVLPRHRDRPACELSFSLSLGYRGAEDWPLCVKGPEGEAAASLRPGEGVLYKGTEIEHWREPFTGDSAAQVFLHYVDQHGPHAAWRFDKREGLRLGA